MAADPAGKPVFNAQNLINSCTVTSGALHTLQAESHAVSQGFNLLVVAPPIALAQIQQQLHVILQQLGQINTNIIGLRADRTHVSRSPVSRHWQASKPASGV